VDFVNAKLGIKRALTKNFTFKFFSDAPLNYLKINELKMIKMQVFQSIDNQQVMMALLFTC
jgi:hypothetical protein